MLVVRWPCLDGESLCQISHGRTSRDMLDWRLYKSYKFEVKFSCNVVKDSGCGVLMLIFTSQKAACHLNCSVPEVLIADGTNLSLD